MKKYIISSLVALALVIGVSSPARAATVEELQAIIVQLTNQLVSMQAQLNALQGVTNSESTGPRSSGGSGSSSANKGITINLVLGSRGDDVVRLQNFLISKGFLVVPNGTAKGYFGPTTKAAVIKYQVASGISENNGYVGPITRSKINAELGTEVGSSKISIKDVTSGNLRAGNNYDVTWLTSNKEVDIHDYVAIGLRSLSDDGIKNVMYNEKPLFYYYGSYTGDVPKLEITIPQNTKPGKYALGLHRTSQGYTQQVNLIPNSEIFVTIGDEGPQKDGESANGLRIKSTDLRSVNTDKVGIWDVFGPGKGNANKNDKDWLWRLIINSEKVTKIKSIKIEHTPAGEGWATDYVKMYNRANAYPLKVVGSAYENTKYVTDLNLEVSKGDNQYDLYGQPESTSFLGGKITVEFADGTVLYKDIPSSSIKAPYAQVESGKSIQITSPISGAKLQAGKAYSITWNKNFDLTSGQKLFLALDDKDGLRKSYIKTDITTASSFDWTIPNNFVPGDYLLVLNCSYGEAPCDGVTSGKVNINISKSSNTSNQSPEIKGTQLVRESDAYKLNFHIVDEDKDAIEWTVSWYKKNDKFAESTGSGRCVDVGPINTFARANGSDYKEYVKVVLTVNDCRGGSDKTVLTIPTTPPTAVESYISSESRLGSGSDITLRPGASETVYGIRYKVSGNPVVIERVDVDLIDQKENRNAADYISSIQLLDMNQRLFATLLGTAGDSDDDTTSYRFTGLNYRLENDGGYYIRINTKSSLPNSATYDVVVPKNGVRYVDGTVSDTFGNASVVREVQFVPSSVINTPTIPFNSPDYQRMEISLPNGTKQVIYEKKGTNPAPRILSLSKTAVAAGETITIETQNVGVTTDTTVYFDTFKGNRYESKAKATNTATGSQKLVISVSPSFANGQYYVYLSTENGTSNYKGLTVQSGQGANVYSSIQELLNKISQELANQ